MTKATDAKFTCKRCDKHFKTRRFLQIHREKFHSKANGKSKDAPKATISHTDIIAMLNVKIDALREVKAMLEHL